MSTILKKYRHKIIEYIKFNIIGISNFVISQGIYLTLFIYFKLHYLLAYTITSVISITASYILNSKYTFKEKKYSYKKFFYSILIYIFEYILNMGVIVILVNVFKLGEILSPIIAPTFTTPPIFLLMRKVIKK
ncbi:GtrA family protein [Romboutsia sp. 1001216sp1]|uniref:GtrA family protein n=1 Tax=Romboutsia sp. 1001216sp1 TaxID=2986997 RepID=UPI002330B9AF|nr:GtrA family protein [Romboutsia sp. 1001216sp1]MDB8803877.1 GtrA family protein [Romboutsia sp. 1001216sp1]MDB8806773.1 GtrA family protein [Romboutsia sp. 1001216sp1]MDB8809524.1 GtrA family protein [Romboutsia sp. 1001216sp1]MDB8815273.1 GtrA family protein [Romboutsia sp. 1001216sp1]MDB8817966.1 GtrA family protein [Romboutsia sp. 1001216sp1]